MMSGLTLVLGGVRSGKSAFAEQIASASGPRILYIATAEATDAEMLLRIQRHRGRRPSNWQTLETPYDPAAALLQHGEGCDAILLDCLSIWVSNLLLAALPSEAFDTVAAERAEAGALTSVDELLDWQRQSGIAMILVSNEVGQGVVPPYPLGRLYRDILGRANQRVAARADRVYYLIAGLALDLKCLGASPFLPRET